MKDIRISTKEEDAILSMIEYFVYTDHGFLTRSHKRITQKELLELKRKVREA